MLWNPILDAWRSGSACDSSNADIHKVIRSNRVAFIDLTIHDCLFLLLFSSFLPMWSIPVLAVGIHVLIDIANNVQALLFLFFLSQAVM